MELLTWNIQFGRGADGRNDLARIVDALRAPGPADVLCLQEVAENFPDLAGAEADQPSLLARAFPGYAPVFAPALDLAGEGGARRRFGNLILSRLPVLATFAHSLPRPADATGNYFPRVAQEAVIEAPFGALRVVATHLEYYSAVHRASQVERLREVHAESSANARLPRRAGLRRRPRFGVRPPASALLCGDFNFAPGDALYARLTHPFAGGAPPLVDAWTGVHGGLPHAPTCGVHDRVQWPQGAHTRDYVFLTPDLALRLALVVVDQETRASDHQPVRVVLGD